MKKLKLEIKKLQEDRGELCGKTLFIEKGNHGLILRCVKKSGHSGRCKFSHNSDAGIKIDVLFSGKVR